MQTALRKFGPAEMGVNIQDGDGAQGIFQSIVEVKCVYGPVVVSLS